MIEPSPDALRVRLDRAYRRRFDDEPPTFVVWAPGRVNLLGEHTDYNDGLVLPVAIDRGIGIALRPRDDGRVVAHSRDVEGEVDLRLDGLDEGVDGWGAYVAGVAWALREATTSDLRGWEGVVAGDLPVGAGLASSAALGLAVARAFAGAAGLAWQPEAMARVVWRAERERVGVECGIMDPMVAAAGRAGCALLLDCRTMALEHVRLPPDLSLLVLDTGTRRELRASAYNRRRRECAEAARALGSPSLRDVTEERLEALGSTLPPALRRRARHVVTENARVREAVDALRRGDVTELGRLLDAGHASLRDDFEVSSPALDAIVGLAREQPGCLGARMTGAGFAGCAVAIARSEEADGIAERVARTYREATGRPGRATVCSAVDGAGLL